MYNYAIQLQCSGKKLFTQVLRCTNIGINVTVQYGYEYGGKQ